MAVLKSNDRAEYAAILENARATRSADQIANRFPWQTALAVRSLLDLARATQAEIRLLCGTCAPNFFDDELVQKLSDCLDAGCKATVVAWNDDASVIASRIQALAEAGRLELLISGTREMGDKLPHFLLVGDAAYRQEAGHPYISASQQITETAPEIPARICFNDPVGGKSQAVLFELLASFCRQQRH